MRIGGVTLERGKIVNMVIDSIPSAPSFNSENSGEFTFSLSDKVLRFNDGEKLVALNTTVSEDPNLIASLGSNWLNEDLTFNPVPFNELEGISGLTGTDSLFTVIDQMTTLIDNVSTIALSDIDMSQYSSANDMSVVAYLSGDLLLFDIEQILEGSTISLTFDNLEGFNITDTTEGNMIIFNTNNTTHVDELVAQTVHFTYYNLASGVSHTLRHNLGVRHCAVFCIDPQTHAMITPDSITFDSDNEAVVHLSVAGPLKAFVYNFESLTKRLENI